MPFLIRRPIHNANYHSLFQSKKNNFEEMVQTKRDQEEKNDQEET